MTGNQMYSLYIRRLSILEPVGASFIVTNVHNVG